MTPVIEARDGLNLPSYPRCRRRRSRRLRQGERAVRGPARARALGGATAWLQRTAQQLANRGFAVLQVNFRGSTGFGKAFVNAADKQWARKMHDDLIDAVAWAVKSGAAPKDKICIAGGSYGGYATLVGLAMTPDVFACGVDIVAPRNINTLLKSVPRTGADDARFKRRSETTTRRGKAALDAASPLTHAAKILAPAADRAGANDPRVSRPIPSRSRRDEGARAARHVRRVPRRGPRLLAPREQHRIQRRDGGVPSAHLDGFYLPLTQEELAASSIQIQEGKSGIPGCRSEGEPHEELLVLALLAACGAPALKARPEPARPVAEPTPARSPSAREPKAPPHRVATASRMRTSSRAACCSATPAHVVQLSPDGKMLSWLAPKDGVLNVHVAPVGKLDQAKAITSETKRPVRQYFWAYTSKHVVYIQDTEGDENFHLFRADIADGKTADLTPYKGARADLLETNHRFPRSCSST